MLCPDSVDTLAARQQIAFEKRSEITDRGPRFADPGLERAQIDARAS